MTQRLPLVMDTGNLEQLQAADYLDGAETLAGIAGGRLTLTTNVPVTTSDVTATSTPVYYTPYIHDRISLYNGTRWTTYQFAQIASGNLTASSGTLQDVFVSWNSGSPSVTTANWTNATTRATALTLLNGVWVLSTDNTQRYVGTVAFSATNAVADTAVYRGVWNMNNRVIRGMLQTNSTSHTYTTGTWREWNNGSTEKISWVIGQNEDAMRVGIHSISQIAANGTEQNAYTGFFLDSAVTPPPNQYAGMATVGTSTSATIFPMGARATLAPSTISTVGTHFITAGEFGSATATFSSYTLSASLPM